MLTSKTPPWGNTRESVAAWCALPIGWNRKREGFRRPPKLAGGDAGNILIAAGLAGVTDGWGPLDTAIALDSDLLDLESARDGGDWEEITFASGAVEDAVDDFYSALRKALHPDAVAAEEAALDAMRSEPLPGLEEGDAR